MVKRPHLSVILGNAADASNAIKNVNPYNYFINKNGTAPDALAVLLQTEPDHVKRVCLGFDVPDTDFVKRFANFMGIRPDELHLNGTDPARGEIVETALKALKSRTLNVGDHLAIATFIGHELNKAEHMGNCLIGAPLHDEHDLPFTGHRLLCKLQDNIHTRIQPLALNPYSMFESKQRIGHTREVYDRMLDDYEREVQSNASECLAAASMVNANNVRSALEKREYKQKANGYSERHIALRLWRRSVIGESFLRAGANASHIKAVLDHADLRPLRGVLAQKSGNLSI